VRQSLPQTTPPDPVIHPVDEVERIGVTVPFSQTFHTVKISAEMMVDRLNTPASNVQTAVERTPQLLLNKRVLTTTPGIFGTHRKIRVTDRAVLNTPTAHV
jgi:hypothetical protein